MTRTVLIIDTCTEALVVSLVRDGEFLAGKVEQAGPLKGARLLPLLEEVLHNAELDYHHILLVAAGRGPGSFTGIRNGLATALGIANALSIPAYGICPLISLAASNPFPGKKMLVVLDARRQQVYVRLCRFDDNGLPFPLEAPRLMAPQQIPENYLVGDIIIPEAHNLGMTPEGLARSFIAQEAQGILGRLLPSTSAHPMPARQLADLTFDFLCDADVASISRTDRLCFPLDYWTPSVFREELANPLAKYLVAKKRRHIVGYGGIWLMADEGHIVNLAVHPKWRGMGLGRVLLARMLALAIVKELSLASLLVRASNKTAQALYFSVGFELHKVVPGYYEDGEDGWLMTLSLPGLSKAEL